MLAPPRLHCEQSLELAMLILRKRGQPAVRAAADGAGVSVP